MIRGSRLKQVEGIETIVTEPDLTPEKLGQLLRLAAHDLRNPLAVILSNLGYLKGSLAATPGDVTETLTDTLTSCGDLEHIIENLDLLGWRLEKERVALSTVDLLGVLAQVTRAAEPLAQSHEVTLVSNALSDAQLLVIGERNLLFRCLSNLLRNSIQHSPAGAEVHVRLESESDCCRVRVLDSGTLLNADWRAATFTVDGQISAKGSGEGRYGRGLGSYVAHCAAEALGAELSIEPAAAPHQQAFVLVLKR